MKRCTNCSRPATLHVCADCAQRAEDILRPNVPWTPFVEADTIHDDLQAEGFQTCFKNSRYTVWVRRPASPDGELIHLSIKRNDKSPVHDWRDLQRIKNEILGPEEEACELYPAESRMVDGANQYHLWSFKGQRAPFGYETRCVIGPEDSETTGAKQRPFENPPQDVMTNAEFEQKAAEHKRRQLEKATLSRRINETIAAAKEGPCAAGPGTLPAERRCNAVHPDAPGLWCGPCLARVLTEMARRVEELR